MTIEVDDRIDPTLNDPMEIADSIVETYLEMRDVNPQYPTVELAGAEWL